MTPREFGEGVNPGMSPRGRKPIRPGTCAVPEKTAMVTCDLPAGETWVGVPARNLEVERI